MLPWRWFAVTVGVFRGQETSSGAWNQLFAWALINERCITMTTSDETATSLAQQEGTTHPYTSDRAPVTTSDIGIGQPRSLRGELAIEALVFAICVVGFVANLAVLVSHLASNRQTATRKTVNVFICNQTVLDLVAMFATGVKMVMQMSGYLKTKTGVLRMLPI